MNILGVEELEESDLASLNKGRGGTIAVSRQMHHTIAKLVARGHTDVDIGRIVGRSAPTIRNWRLTPANQNLAAEYAEDVDDEIQDQMAYRLELRRKAGILAMERLVDALESGEDIPHRTLVAIAADSDDRTGLARTETRVNLNASIGAQLDRAAKRLKAMRKVEAKVVTIVPTQPSAQSLVGFVEGAAKREKALLGIERRL